MKITTVKNQNGDVLESLDIRTVRIDTSSKTLVLEGSSKVVRLDGAEVVSSSHVNVQVGEQEGPGMGVASVVDSSEMLTITPLVSALLDELIEALNSKSKTTDA